MQVFNHLETEPKRPTDWLKVALIISFSLVLIAALWELSL